VSFGLVFHVVEKSQLEPLEMMELKLLALMRLAKRLLAL